MIFHKYSIRRIITPKFGKNCFYSRKSLKNKNHVFLFYFSQKKFMSYLFWVLVIFLNAILFLNCFFCRLLGSDLSFFSWKSLHFTRSISRKGSFFSSNPGKKSFFTHSVVFCWKNPQLQTFFGKRNKTFDLTKSK